MYKYLPFIFLITLITACTMPSSKHRFPGYAERAKTLKHIDVLLDVMVLADIAGSDVGYDKLKNSAALNQAKAVLNFEFNQRGYKPNFVLVDSGFFFIPDPDIRYFYSQNNQKTEVEYKGWVESSELLWAKPEVRDYLSSAMNLAARYRSNEYEAVDSCEDDEDEYEECSDKVEEKPVIASDEQLKGMALAKAPDFLKRLPADVLFIVKTNTGEVGMDKSIGVGLLTASLSLLASGGTYVHSSAPTSSTQVHIAAIDLSDERVIWHAQGFDQVKSGKVGMVIKSTMESLPNSQGGI